jgi:hypothetical protein
MIFTRTSLATPPIEFAIENLLPGTLVFFSQCAISEKLWSKPNRAICPNHHFEPIAFFQLYFLKDGSRQSDLFIVVYL